MVAKTYFKTFHVLPMTAALKRIQNAIYKDLLHYARHKTGNPKLENLNDHPDLEALCDLHLLLKAGVVRTEYSDCLPGLESEGILLMLNMERG